MFYLFWLAEGWEKPLRLLQNLLAPGLTSSLAIVVSQIGGPIFAASMITTRVGLGSADMARVVGKAVHKQSSSFLLFVFLRIPSTFLAHPYLCFFEVLRRSLFVHLPLIRSAGLVLAFCVHNSRQHALEIHS